MKTPLFALLAGFALVGCQTQETPAPAKTAPVPPKTETAPVVTPAPAKAVPAQRNLAVGRRLKA